MASSNSDKNEEDANDAGEEEKDRKKCSLWRKSKPSRFHFLGADSDSDVGNDLERLQVDALRKKEEFRCRVRSIEDRIAGWSSRLAEEALSREQSHKETLESAVYLPLEQCVQRVLSKMDCHFHSQFLDDEGGTLRRLEKQAAQVEQNMFDLKHVTCFHAETEHLRSLKKEMRRNTRTALKLESAKALRREAAIVRRMEEIAARSSRDFISERASTLTDVLLLQDNVQHQVCQDEKRLSAFQHEVHALRAHLDKETQERRRQDQLILDQIIRTKDQLHKTVIDTLGGGDYMNP